jgi:molybdopterin-biosynthesis enzyme MoeA-like protein
MVIKHPIHSTHVVQSHIAYYSISDITYSSLAKSFNQPLQYHKETIHRLTEMTQHRPWAKQQNEEQRTATMRMALLPEGEESEVLFVGEDLWVVSNLSKTRV